VSLKLSNRKKGAFMRRAKISDLLFFVAFLLLGVSHVYRYSEKVRFVHLLGISAGGALIGVALVGIVGWRFVRTGKLRWADEKPAEEGPPLPDQRTH
jgi:hypothetical protein